MTRLTTGLLTAALIFSATQATAATKYERNNVTSDHADRRRQTMATIA